MTEPSDRFLRQTRFAPFGPEGQAALSAARVAVVGVGGLGASLAEHLTRAGVGFLRLIDRDVVEESNLPRQALYTAADAEAGAPKAEAAAKHLAAIGGSTRLEARSEDLSLRNVAALLGDIDLVLDGLDSFTTRFLINDWCHANHKAWIHGGAVASTGSVLRIRAGGRPCLRCVFPEPEAPETFPTCETAGVLTPLPALIAALQASEAMRHFAEPQSPTRLWQIDPWSGRALSITPELDAACPCCREAAYPALESGALEPATSLCGRDVVQVHPEGTRRVALEALVEKWQGMGRIEHRGSLARLHLDAHTLSVFPDGRALVKGTDSPSEARALYARYVGC